LRRTVVSALAVAGALLAVAAPAAAAAWTELEPGLERARFAADGTAAEDGAITVVRIDPVRWELRLLSTPADAGADNRSVREWCEKHGLVAAVNAGMFATDYRTHIGYMRCGGSVNNHRVNAYESVAAFGPRRDELPPFRIFDLDVTDFETIDADYECVLQNLRLIKRPGENRWPQQEKAWSEVALAEDREGRALFVHCRDPYSMHDLNEILLALPIGIVCAQHLEGGPQAQLVLVHPEHGVELAGSRETEREERDRWAGWPVPNVLGVARGGP
jgi:hypothetical protein